TFERLADHHELLRVAIARAEVEVREPAATTTVSPLGREYHEIERPDRLDLPPRRAPATGVVARVERLRHRSLVSGCERAGQELLGDDRFFGLDRRHSPRADEAGQDRRAVMQWTVEQVVAVEMQHVEEERREGQRMARRIIAAEAAH